jgi:hypothetical protein
MLSEIPGVNAEVDWPELRAVFARMNNWKAAGASGNILELFKYALLGEEDDEPSALRIVLLKLLNMMLKGGYIAEILQVSLLITVPKKGDLSDRNNHRGISLIEPLSKILHTIIAGRINKGLEDLNRLCRAQAGFRRSEEALGHIVTLHDLCIRRRMAGLKTFILFLDMVKAYDRVPHWAFLLKAKRIGVRGQMLKLLENILKTANITVLDQEALPFHLDRGLGQGWPDSPDGFNIFVNDIMDKQVGVVLPGSVSAATGLETVIPGLLFADDGVILADSLEGMRAAIEVSEEWGGVNCMKFGISKCALMCVSDEQDQALDMQELKLRNFKLDNESIPVVEDYVYLGGKFSSDLKLDGMVKHRLHRANGAVMSIAPVLSNVKIPLSMRRLLALAFIQPTLTYGGELLGMRAAGLASPLQKVMNSALNKMIMGRERFQVRASADAIMIELGIPPIQACLDGARARAFAKYKISKSYVGSLYEGAAQGWVGQSNSWLVKNAPPLAMFNKIGKKFLVKANKAEFLSYDEVPPKMLSKKIKWVMAEKIWAKRDGTSLERYRENKYRETRGYIKGTAAAGVEFSKGYHRIFQMRCGGFTTGRRAARQYKINDLLECCFCCNTNVIGGETIGHFLLDCQAWEEERELLKPIMTIVKRLARENNATWFRDDLVSLLLGGIAVIDADTEATLGDLWSLGPHLGDDEYGTPLSRHVAGFLSAVDAQRTDLLYRAIVDGLEFGAEEVDMCDLLVETVAPTGSQSPDLCDLLVEEVEEDILLR